MSDNQNASAPTAPGREEEERERNRGPSNIDLAEGLESMAANLGLARGYVGILKNVARIFREGGPSSAHPSQGLVKTLEKARNMAFAIYEMSKDVADADVVEGNRKFVEEIEAALQGKNDGCAAPFYSRQTAEKMTGLEEAEWIVKACREARDEGATDTRVSFRDDMVLVEGWKDFPASLPPPHFSSTPFVGRQALSSGGGE